MMFFRRWFVRRRDNAPGCPYCHRLLQLCQSCLGHWRQAACGACCIGLLCPTHDRFWNSP